MLTSQDTVEPADLGADPYPENAYNMPGPTWFFWIDTNKWAKFIHLKKITENQNGRNH